MGNSKIKKLTLLKNTKFLSLYDAEYVNKKGILRHWTIASRKDYETLNAEYFEGKKETIDAVILAAYHEESKKIVLVKQFRVPLNDYVYELPAGLIDGNEDIESAVARELNEETGLNLLKINNEKSKPGVYVSVGMTNESLALIYCSCSGIITNKYLEDDEDIEAVLISKDEAKELLRKNIKMDIKVYMLLQSFSELGEKLFS